MHFTTIVSFSLAAIASAAPHAQPVAQPAEATASATTKLIDLWQDKGFLGLKFTGSANFGDCKNLKGTGFVNNVSSAKSKPGFRCTIWIDTDCNGTGFSFNADPGASSLPTWIDNTASSWKCVNA